MFWKDCGWKWIPGHGTVRGKRVRKHGPLAMWQQVGPHVAFQRHPNCHLNGGKQQKETNKKQTLVQRIDLCYRCLTNNKAVVSNTHLVIIPLPLLL